MYRRTLTINWDGLAEDDDDDHFFESRERLSTAVPQDLPSSGSDDEVEFEDSRRSFSTSVSIKNNFRGVQMEKTKSIVISNPPAPIVMEDYGMWMAEPGDVKERRKRLLQGMGLTSKKELLKITSAKVVRAITRKVDTCQDSKPTVDKPTVDIDSSKEEVKQEDEEQEPESSNSPPILLLRSRSDGDIQFFSVNTKKRKEQLIGDVSKQRLTRTFSGVLGPATRICQYTSTAVMAPPKKGTSKPSPLQNGGETPSSTLPNGCADSGFASFFLIKNLDTGTEFIVKESNEEGMWNKLSDLQTGKQLSMEEFEKSVGHSPVVKELMRRANSNNDERKLNVNAYLNKSFRYSKKTGVALLKNIKGVANSMSGSKADREFELPAPVEQKQNKNSSQWIKVRQQGKINKEFTALQLCQEIEAHEGSIWTVRFSADARYLATAGEDRVIHVWEVQDCDVMSTKPSDDPNSVSDTPMAGSNSDRPPLPVMNHMQSERKKKGKTSSKKKSNSLPDYVNVPETVFSLSEKPVCTFNGHQEDVLDLCWSSSQVSFHALISLLLRFILYENLSV
ncbi:hypothetical protein HAX54_039542 [Datura stramonium]|uniref:Uncharacterized protein n=1 Tax=Datura stramonium TaxID=4076 RepID=A0ABS8VN92_DATST|nr:hypothetical protein [Datura stramonium]